MIIHFLLDFLVFSTLLQLLDLHSFNFHATISFFAKSSIGGKQISLFLLQIFRGGKKRTTSAAASPTRRRWHMHSHFAAFCLPRGILGLLPTSKQRAVFSTGNFVYFFGVVDVSLIRRLREGRPRNLINFPMMSKVLRVRTSFGNSSHCFAAISQALSANKTGLSGSVG
jgi:hypothetical protein